MLRSNQLHAVQYLLGGVMTPPYDGLPDKLK